MGTQPEFPWVAVMQANELEQGDMLRKCPHFMLPRTFAQMNSGAAKREMVDAIVLTQSCDLVCRADAECEATDVLFCPFYAKKDLTDHPVFRKDEAWEDVRKGRRPFYHVLNECKVPGNEQDFA